MKRILLFFLIFTTALLIFTCLVWFFAIPDSLIKDTAEGVLSTPQLEVSAEGITKGLPFTVYADTLNFKIKGVNALKITGIRLRLNLFYLFKGQTAFSITGALGKGSVKGDFRFPEDGYIEVTNMDIEEIPYLSSLGLKGNGVLWGRLDIGTDVSQVRFKISKAHIEGLLPAMPLSLSVFQNIQGAFSITNDIVRLNSIALEGDKGYARLKGNISLRGKASGGFMNLTLELMPIESKLEPFEAELIKRYMVSPGYYAILIEGPL
ncbi:MAG: type II secretion system protein GspN [Nitrospirae bacterium]|nr:type II secretion system protein GspN [Nitrospirota bacterium]